MPVDCQLSARLLQEAVDHAEHPAEAVSALMSAAATILMRTFGEEGAISLLTMSLDETAGTWRAKQLN
jgi:hypothetical protein